MIEKKKNGDAGFTLIEIVIAVAIVAVFAAVISPMVFKHLEDAKISKAGSESEIIATALLGYYKDVGQWPYTNEDGKRGSVDRLISSEVVAKGKSAGSKKGAKKWGTFGKSMQLGDYLYANSIENGEGTWRGPYTEKYSFNDPWGNAYVVNCRYLPSGKYKGSNVHKVIVLSAGPDGRWATSFNDGTTETISGDDIGYVVTVQ